MTDTTIQTSSDSAPQAGPMLRDDERQRCEVWTRVMGYHRPVASFNVGKQGEFQERTYFVESRCAHSTGSRTCGA
jgi:hypothetical protein